jgi:hypothetical protein
MFQYDSQIPASRDSQPMPPIGTLDEFGLDSSCEDGVTLSDLEPGTRITVATRNSTYRLDVIDGAKGRVTVVGGTVFPEHTNVRVEGSTDGGSVIKAGWIGVGMRLEMTNGMRRITTSRVQAVEIDRPLASAPAA